MCILIKNNTSTVIYDIDLFQIINIFLLDTKKNIIMNGKFTKIIYSNELITLYGIFLKIPFNIYKEVVNKQLFSQNENFLQDIKNNNLQISNIKYKKICNLQTEQIINSKIITDLIAIELQILEFYKNLFKCNKEPIYILKNQLKEGNIKLYKDYYENCIN